MIIEREVCGLDYQINESKLVYADKLVTEMIGECAKYSKLLELAKKDRIEVIKEVVRYMYYSEHLLDNAQKWLSMLKEGVDKRKHYDEKDSFDYIQNALRKEIFNNPTIEIKSIAFMGYEKYTYLIDFKVEDSDIVFQVAIPNVSMLKEELWNEMRGGKLALSYHQNTNVLDLICESYKEMDINKAFIDFLNKHEYY
jgi:hypothetical protein